MADLIETYARVADGFGKRLRAVTQGQWNSATPCADWDVRQLVGHVLDEQLWVPPLVEGFSVAEVGDRFAGDQLGDRPVDAWDRAASGALAALSGAGVLQRVVHLSYGDTSAEDYGWQVAADTIVHTWDLARAVGADERLEEGDVAVVEEVFGPGVEPMREGGVLGPALEVPADADPQTRMLAKFGRRA